MQNVTHTHVLCCTVVCDALFIWLKNSSRGGKESSDRFEIAMAACIIHTADLIQFLWLLLKEFWEMQ